MPERATVTQGFQIAKEVTPGTIVAAAKKLQSLNLTLGPKLHQKMLGAQGYKTALATELGKEWSAGKVDGYLSYNEIVYLLNGCLHTQTPVIIGAGPGYTNTYTPSGTAQDTPLTYSVEQGDATRAHAVDYLLFNGLQLGWTKESIKVSAPVFARELQDGITLTAPTVIAQQVAQPQDTDFYLDTTSGGLGGTALTRLLACDLDIGERWAPVFTADSAEPSFAAHTEKGLNVKGKLKVEANSVGTGFLTNWRAGDTRFLRWKTVGASFTGGAYTFQVDAAIKFAEPSEFGDDDGVYMIEWPFEVVYDTTWAKSIEILVKNQVSAL